MAITTDQQVRALLKAANPTKKAVGDGVYFRVTKEGTGFWIYKYTFNGRRCEISFGRYPDLSLREARIQGVEYRKKVTAGLDPLIEREREQSNPFKTVDNLAQSWLEGVRKRIKYPSIPERVYNNDIKPVIGNVLLSDLKARDVKRVIDKISTGQNARPTIANDALGYLKQIFNHGVKLDIIDSNPAAAFRPSDAGGTEQSRDRALSESEIRQLFKAIDKYKGKFGIYNMLSIKLLLLTGVRKGELLQAQWHEIDLLNQCWNLPKERTKTRKPIKIPLSASATNCFKALKGLAFDSEFVFPARRAGKRYGHVSPDTLNRALSVLLSQDGVKLEHFTVHDLRRTYRGLLSQLKVEPHIAERCLNHKLQGVAGVYDTYDYYSERKEANDKVCLYLNSIVN